MEMGHDGSQEEGRLALAFGSVKRAVDLPEPAAITGQRYLHALGGVGQQPLASPRGWSPAGSQLSIPTNMQREENCASCPRDAGGGRL